MAASSTFGSEISGSQQNQHQHQHLQNKNIGNSGDGSIIVPSRRPRRGRRSSIHGIDLVSEFDPNATNTSNQSQQQINTISPPPPPQMSTSASASSGTVRSYRTLRYNNNSNNRNAEPNSGMLVVRIIEIQQRGGNVPKTKPGGASSQFIRCSAMVGEDQVVNLKAQPIQNLGNKTWSAMYDDTLVFDVKRSCTFKLSVYSETLPTGSGSGSGIGKPKYSNNGNNVGLGLLNSQVSGPKNKQQLQEQQHRPRSRIFSLLDTLKPKSLRSRASTLFSSKHHHTNNNNNHNNNSSSNSDLVNSTQQQQKRVAGMFTQEQAQKLFPIAETNPINNNTSDINTNRYDSCSTTSNEYVAGISITTSDGNHLTQEFLIQHHDNSQKSKPLPTENQQKDNGVNTSSGGEIRSRRRLLLLHKSTQSNGFNKASPRWSTFEPGPNGGGSSSSSSSSPYPPGLSLPLNNVPSPLSPHSSSNTGNNKSWLTNGGGGGYRGSGFFDNIKLRTRNRAFSTAVDNNGFGGGVHSAATEAVVGDSQIPIGEMYLDLKVERKPKRRVRYTLPAFTEKQLMLRGGNNAELLVVLEYGIIVCENTNNNNDNGGGLQLGVDHSSSSAATAATIHKSISPKKSSTSLTMLLLQKKKWEQELAEDKKILAQSFVNIFTRAGRVSIWKRYWVVLTSESISLYSHPHDFDIEKYQNKDRADSKNDEVDAMLLGRISLLNFENASQVYNSTTDLISIGPTGIELCFLESAMSERHRRQSAVPRNKQQQVLTSGGGSGVAKGFGFNQLRTGRISKLPERYQGFARNHHHHHHHRGNNSSLVGGSNTNSNNFKSSTTTAATTNTNNEPSQWQCRVYLLMDTLSDRDRWLDILNSTIKPRTQRARQRAATQYQQQEQERQQQQRSNSIGIMTGGGSSSIMVKRNRAVTQVYQNSASVPKPPIPLSITNSLSTTVTPTATNAAQKRLTSLFLNPAVESNNSNDDTMVEDANENVIINPITNPVPSESSSTATKTSVLRNCGSQASIPIHSRKSIGFSRDEFGKPSSPSCVSTDINKSKDHNNSESTIITPPNLSSRVNTKRRGRKTTTTTTRRRPRRSMSVSDFETISAKYYSGNGQIQPTPMKPKLITIDPTTNTSSSSGGGGGGFIERSSSLSPGSSNFISEPTVITSSTTGTFGPKSKNSGINSSSSSSSSSDDDDEDDEDAAIVKIIGQSKQKRTGIVNHRFLFVWHQTDL
ncbi:hypothetical protein H4219_005588 [Mycoemilia scoparia]|uniref:PH domain-containing protein n=1 Tax=Mycoemilia scoparia TaxID=417184 RepID=A0A9W7ZVI1_9FUNG|nr:hypothetical protein H4219_005588 [Mycoemilia scoparia]